MTLQATIETATETFLHTVLGAIRGATLEEISEVPASIRRAVTHVTNVHVRDVSGLPTIDKQARKLAKRAAKLAMHTHDPMLGIEIGRTGHRITATGRLKRRSPEEIRKALGKVLGLLHTKGPMRSEQIRTKLGMLRAELPRVLQEGIKTKQLKTKGQRRATVYTARSV